MQAAAAFNVHAWQARLGRAPSYHVRVCWIAKSNRCWFCVMNEHE